MLQIRNGVFETNSSSSHSIVVTKGNADNVNQDHGWHINDNGICKIYDSEDLEFGRYPFDVLYTWYDRMRYAIASYGDEEHFKEIENLCVQHIENLKQIVLPKDYSSDSNEKETYYGWVDHQSSGLLQHFLDKNNVTLEEFLFNDNYIVIIDGDEYHIFDTLFQTHLIDRNNIK